MEKLISLNKKARSKAVIGLIFLIAIIGIIFYFNFVLAVVVGPPLEITTPIATTTYTFSGGITITSATNVNASYKIK